MTTPPHITTKQAKWFKAVQEGLEQDSGRSLEQWIRIAKTCPEKKHRARLNWFNSEHGLGINRASLILGATFESGLGWDNPENLLDQLWKTPESRAIYDKVEIIAKSFGDDVVIGPRKNFSAFSRRVQFAALRPSRDGVRLGLAIALGEAPNLTAPISSDSWSDRLTAVCVLNDPSDLVDEIKSLLRRAYNLSV